VFAETPRGLPGMLSSYDRTGGNRDWGRFDTRTADGAAVLADLKGPGCLRRLWMTGVRRETEVSFFVDGEQTPRIKRTCDELFGQKEPFLPPLADNVSGGRYSYVPIPFAESLRVLYHTPEDRKNPRVYYQLNYDTYGSSVEVNSFPVGLSDLDSDRLAAVRTVWGDTTNAAKLAKRGCGRREEASLGAGEQFTWLDHSGGGVLRTFWVRVIQPEDLSVVGRHRLTRELVLRMYWDGLRHPSVDVPLGDFFCNGLRGRQFVSLPLARLEDSYVCRFPLPFKRSVRAQIRNDSKTPVTIEAGYDLAPLTSHGDVNYFHASWNSGISAGASYRIFRANGPGHYVGCYLISIGMDGSWNILEGDEFFLIDGETSPSFHGTGLEDYFNAGWYYSGLFHLPLHGLVDKAPIRTSQYRFHLPDPIPFSENIQMQIEFGHGNRARGYMSSVAYWYAEKPHAAGSSIPEGAKRFPPSDPLEKHAIMALLFELERIGRYEEAADACLEYVEKFGGTPQADVIRLREIGYREIVRGYDAVKQEYDAAAKRAPDSDAGRQARTLMWFREDPGNALICAHVNGEFSLYLDGQPVLNGGHPLGLAVRGVGLPPGEHELTAEVKARWSQSWFRMTLRTAGGDVSTDASWKVARKKPKGWPSTDDEGTAWEAVRLMGLPPFMKYWQFLPNAFVGVQSGRRFITLEGGWPTGTVVFFKKRFVVPVEGGGSPAAVPGQRATDGASDPSEAKWDKASGVEAP